MRSRPLQARTQRRYGPDKLQKCQTISHIRIAGATLASDMLCCPSRLRIWRGAHQLKTVRTN